MSPAVTTARPVAAVAGFARSAAILWPRVADSTLDESRPITLVPPVSPDVWYQVSSQTELPDLGALMFPNGLALWQRSQFNGFDSFLHKWRHFQGVA